MIFTQRFFTLLLGLLFATVLTDQASALYDPGVGRFCSRDPIAYVDGANSYSARMSTIGTDPNGTLLIVATYLNHKSPKTNYEGCGQNAWVNWRFELTPSVYNQGPCGGGSYEGYLIQEVTTYCVAASCKSNKENCTCPTKLDEFDDWMFSDDFPGQDMEKFTYYELWKVGRDGDVQGIRYDDKSMIIAQNDSCGFTNQIGELKYFCADQIDINDFKPGNPNHRNNPEASQYYGKSCRTSPGALPSTGEGMNFWNKTPHAVSKPTEMSGTSRAASLKWNCCGKQKDKWTNFTFSPDSESKS